jgi:hypothetical protein
MLVNHPVRMPGYMVGSTYISIASSADPHLEFDWISKQWQDPRTITDLRDAAWARIKAARDAAEFSTFTWSGHTFDSDEISFGRLSQALEAARFAIATNDTAFAQPWKLADNTWITLSAQQVFEVYRARGLNTLNAHLHAEALRQQIDAATRAEQLATITWA